jgi:cytochrome c-type biogenesis protein CcmH/NrfG
LASKSIYERILNLDPDNIKSINNLANILLIIGETNEAFYLFESMLQKIPNNIEKRLKVVDIYSSVGDWSKV